MTTEPTIDDKASEGQEIAGDFLRKMSHPATDSSPFPLVYAEGQEHIVLYANPAFCRLSGQTQEALVGHPFSVSLVEGESNGCARLINEVHLTHKTGELADQKHSTQNAGEAYWSYTVWAVFDADERFRGVMIQVTDTTEATSRRKQASAVSEAITVSAVRSLTRTEQAQARERRKHQAMREADHRMKNQLQSICALLDIQTLTNEKTVPVGELIQIRSHIRALATIQDMLTQDITLEDAPNVLSVRQILQQLLPIMQGVTGIAPIQWSADENLLPVKQGVSLAVIINELVTNAVKHGGKNITLTLSETGQMMRLTVCDDGPGFPSNFDPRVDAHFGLELLESMSRIELGGKITFENQPDGGACVVIVFPKPAVALPTD